ncbi:hypothetical protein EVAR_6763_1 [Eumeta japonica]|uniref:Uncharacterized protein n=1 Tax=Eumeta variegata TaxID=151549 RepID=A0A4C1V5A2_EUMVA|nr:hypothetical protein EVAR_6763_1 [Eumeta japonica]
MGSLGIQSPRKSAAQARESARSAERRPHPLTHGTMAHRALSCWAQSEYWRIPFVDEQCRTTTAIRRIKQRERARETFVNAACTTDRRRDTAEYEDSHFLFENEKSESATAPSPPARRL